jgi:hypothetical protein
MSLDRRQFFRRIWSPAEKRLARRAERYEALETYVRTRLLPYDFTLDEEQERSLLAAVRGELESLPDDELFSYTAHTRVEAVVDRTLQPWRHQSHLSGREERLREVRAAAPDYVTAFLNTDTESPVIEQMKQNYGIDDIDELGRLLRSQIETWINDVDDRLVLQYDVVSVQELVFAQLRSWC